jgi:hypothetical protein
MMDATTRVERAGAGEAQVEAVWRRIALTWLAAFLAPLVLLLLAVVLIDPYDSGRFPTFMPAGSPDERAPTIGISRGRDPRFNAVLLGNSRAVLGDPRHLSALTGLHFVEMAAEGATVRDEMARLQWFARNRPRVDAIVVASDQVWCDPNPAMPDPPDFPYGLYSDSDLAYLKTTLSVSTIVFAKERIRYALGRMPGVDPEGFVDIEAKYRNDWRLDDAPDAGLERVSIEEPPAPIALPALALFDSYLKRLPAETPVVLWMPPYYRNALPPPGTPLGRTIASCKLTLRDWAQRRPRARFVDFATERPESTDPRNFLDRTHVSNRFMRMLEVEIAAAVNQVK